MTAIARSIPIALAAVFVVSGIAFAQAPSGATGTCKDGTYTSAQSKQGACSGHGGVNAWYADQKPAGTSAPAAGAAPAPGTRPSTAAAPAPAEQPGKLRTTAAPGGGAGKVWVNSASKVYHCPGDKWYGKTEKGSYMTEAAAKAQGDQPANNKTCS
jgi:uncharacterized protein DUF3761